MILRSVPCRRNSTQRGAGSSRLALSILALCLAAPTAAAADEVSESVISASFPDRSIAALTTRLAESGPYQRAVLLMPGHPGILKLESPTAFRLKGNFLIRSRKAWLDRETVVFSVDGIQHGAGKGFEQPVQPPFHE